MVIQIATRKVVSRLSLPHFAKINIGSEGLILRPQCHYNTAILTLEEMQHGTDSERDHTIHQWFRYADIFKWWCGFQCNDPPLINPVAASPVEDMEKPHVHPIIRVFRITDSRKNLVVETEDDIEERRSLMYNERLIPEAIIELVIGEAQGQENTILINV